ncbi:UMP-CMP kinase [Backusella circina FSU 941]|nr:UMP-CMP kinase [Backusella circina FSU 941]
MFSAILRRNACRVSAFKKPLTQRLYSSAAPKDSGSPSVPAMLAVASMGLTAYYTFSTSKNGNAMPRKVEEKEETPKQDKQEKPVPAFSLEEVTVVFVLGGPGSGKGTNCEKLTKDYGFVHLSAGDLLRAEQKREGSKYGSMINHYIREGLIVPMEVTIALLEQAMKEAIAQGKGTRFLVDGFPRKLDQAIKFEEVVVPSKLVLYFECPEEIMLKRLLKRGESSGRVDDNIESIRKRFVVFTETSMPVIDMYEKEDKVRKITCNQPVDQVYESVKVIFDDMFAENK